MSTPDTQPPAPEGARPHPQPTTPVPTRPVRDAPPRGGGMLGLALLLALVALLAAGYVGWRQWQQMQGSAADSASLDGVRQRVATLESSLAALKGARASLDQRLGDVAQANRSLRDDLLNQTERTRHLEDAVATLAEKTSSGREPMLLDETESLLRMAGERYRLFNDAQGAQAAYALADQTLAAVNDGVFSAVRQSINAERTALAQSQPVSQVAALQQLQGLREQVDSLPLKSLDRPAETPADSVWSRVGRALASIISVRRDNGAPLAVADARFARELTALDLAQAQMALLAYDRDGYAAALQRADARFSTQFDTGASDVRQARATLQQLRAALPTTPPVTLGAALTELRSLRAVHALVPAGAGSSMPPAPTASARGVKP